MTKIIVTYDVIYESNSPLPIPEMGFQHLTQHIHGNVVGHRALTMFLNRDHVGPFVGEADFINDRLNQGQWFYVNKQTAADTVGAALIVKAASVAVVEDDRAYRFVCYPMLADSKIVIAQGERLEQAVSALTAAMGTSFANAVVRNLEVTDGAIVQLTLGIWKVIIERHDTLAQFNPVDDAIVNPVIAAYHTTVEKAVHPDRVSMDIVVGVGMDGELSPLKCDITGHQFTRHFQQAAIAEYHLLNNPFDGAGASAANCAPDWVDAQLTIRSVSINY